MCHYVEGEGPENLISTRELFPNDFDSSIKQKTRWTTGIAFQGLNNLGWFGNFWQRYFLWRDRKGPINAFLTFNMLGLLILLPLLNLSPFKVSVGLNLIFSFNTLGMIFRFGIRFHCVQRLFGRLAAFGVFLRWPVAMLINMSAGLRSTHQYLESSVTGEKIKWAKTQHRLPVGFGSSIPVQPQIQPQTVQTGRKENVATI